MFDQQHYRNTSGDGYSLRDNNNNSKEVSNASSGTAAMKVIILICIQFYKIIVVANQRTIVYNSLWFFFKQIRKKLSFFVPHNFFMKLTALLRQNKTHFLHHTKHKLVCCFAIKKILVFICNFSSLITFFIWFVCKRMLQFMGYLFIYVWWLS